MHSDYSPISRPPIRLIVVMIGMMFASLQGWIRFVLSITNWSIYQAFGILPGVGYLTLTGLFSGCVYLAAAVIAFFRGKKSKKLSSFLLLVGLAGFWFDRIFKAVSPEARTTLPFSLISSAGLTIGAIVILYWDTIVRQIVKQESKWQTPKTK
jgi:hypothetical protein